MKITIQQCLHGYLNGHQLLASSTELSPEARRLLLFQSDLSGPKTNSGFETYLTSYPLTGSIYFALARTWYATEMPRPGCVWTQTLLIELADLGKIPELSSLLEQFQRPTVNNYSPYEKKLSVDFEDLFKGYNDKRSAYYDAIANGVYTFPKQSIILEAANSDTYQSTVLDLWSDQWPRLRRNFTFCTGALSLKSFGSRPFDLQIVPQKNSTSIIRAGETIKIIDLKQTSYPKWLNTIHRTSKNQLREFLWSFGADMVGERENYRKLVELYATLNEQKADIAALSQMIGELLPQPDAGKTFKNSVFGSNGNYGRFSEIDLLRYLLESPNLDFLDLQDFELSKRLVNLYLKNQIGLSEFLQLTRVAVPGRLDDSIYDQIHLPLSEAAETLDEYNFLIAPMLSGDNEIIYLKDIWETNLGTQEKIYRSIVRKFPEEFPALILNNILEAKSEIIFDVETDYRILIVEHSLNWYNKGLNELLPSWRNRIFHHYYQYFTDWVSHNLNNIHPKILIEIFQRNTQDWVYKLPFDHHEWIDVYAILRKAQNVNLPYLSSLFLSKGLKNSMYGSEWLVTMTFNDVYSFAQRSELSGHWNLIPKDIDDYDDYEDLGAIGTLFKIFGFSNSKKNKDVQSWDYCEILIRTVSNKYVKCNWSPQAYLDTFREANIFNRSVIYLLSKKGGIGFLNKVKNNAFKAKKITPLPFQKNVLSNIELE